jgi:hypothetical protein
VAVLAWYAYGFAFGFYGLVLSFFAEMEPHSLFGRNGFINSDFNSAVGYLVVAFWPMAAGALIANWRALFRTEPWQRMLLPFRTEVLRLHVLVLVMPLIALLTWALLGNRYQPAAVLLLMGLFYLWPRRSSRAVPAGGAAPLVIISGER